MVYTIDSVTFAVIFKWRRLWCISWILMIQNFTLHTALGTCTLPRQLLQFNNHFRYTHETFSIKKISCKHFESKMFPSCDLWSCENDLFFTVVRIYRPWYIDKNKDHGISWDLGVMSTWNFHKKVPLTK